MCDDGFMMHDLILSILQKSMEYVWCDEDPSVSPCLNMWWNAMFHCGTVVSTNNNNNNLHSCEWFSWWVFSMFRQVTLWARSVKREGTGMSTIKLNGLLTEVTPGFYHWYTIGFTIQTWGYWLLCRCYHQLLENKPIFLAARGNILSFQVKTLKSRHFVASAAFRSAYCVALGEHPALQAGTNVWRLKAFAWACLGLHSNV